MGLQCNDEMQEDVMSETDIIEAKEQVSSVIFEHQEQEIPHNPYDRELREMDSIRRGDVEMLKHSMSETYRGKLGSWPEIQSGRRRMLLSVLSPLLPVLLSMAEWFRKRHFLWWMDIF